MKSFAFLAIGVILLIPHTVSYGETSKKLISVDILGVISQDSNNGVIFDKHHSDLETLPIGFKSMHLVMESNPDSSIDNIDAIEYPLYSTKFPQERIIRYDSQIANRLISYVQYNLDEIPRSDFLNDVNLEDAEIRLTIDFASLTYDKYLVFLHACSDNIEGNALDVDSLTWDARPCQTYDPIESMVIERNMLPRIIYFDVHDDLQTKISQHKKMITFALEAVPLDETSTIDRDAIYENLFKNFRLSDFGLSEKTINDGSYRGTIYPEDIPSDVYFQLFGHSVENKPMYVEINNFKLSKLDIIDPYGGIIRVGSNTYTDTGKPILIIKNNTSPSALSNSLTFFFTAMLPSIGAILSGIYIIVNKQKKNM